MFLTYITFKRPLLSMSAKMQLQFTWPFERFLTYITCKWLLPSIIAQMQLWGLWYIERFLCISLVNWCSSLRVHKFLSCSSDIWPISCLEPISASSGTRTVWIRKKSNVTVCRTNLSNPNSIYEEIKGKLKLRNAGYHLEQNFFSSSSLYKNTNIKIERTIILLVLLFCCETWSVTLRMEQRLKFFENRMLRKIFGPETDEVNRDRRRSYKEESYDLYSSLNVIWVMKSRRMRTGYIEHMGDKSGSKDFWC